ncbi:transmembrane protein 240 isoform X2 [Kryptolebias marmoratus]|uniref:transmembrane protein 240 isoform X2 n=1 Tax=Kryptolebias marmoratus TaxID=37003 RepID=UPI0018ACA422|nr:transmembrane protein 240 isoform X2 [Kryptolebias marmoratus]
MATREKADSKVGAKLATLRDGNSSGPDGQNRCDDTDNRRRGMDALLNCLKNLILPLLKGEDHICRCHCAREQAYHVVPYHEALEVYSPRHFMLPEDSMPVMVGLVVGVFIFWFLLWLVAILRSFKDKMEEREGEL